MAENYTDMPTALLAYLDAGKREDRPARATSFLRVAFASQSTQGDAAGADQLTASQYERRLIATLKAQAGVEITRETTTTHALPFDPRNNGRVDTSASGKQTTYSWRIEAVNMAGVSYSFDQVLFDVFDSLYKRISTAHIADLARQIWQITRRDFLADARGVEKRYAHALAVLQQRPLPTELDASAQQAFLAIIEDCVAIYKANPAELERKEQHDDDSL